MNARRSARPRKARLPATARAKHLTVRSVPADVAKALATEQRRRGASVNATVIMLLRQALGLVHGEPFDNGLARLAGTWSSAEHEAFERATEHFEAIDEELWR